MSRRFTTVVLACALSLVLAGCGGDESSPAPSAGENAYEPTASPAVEVTMIDPPADYTTVEGTGFSISAPGEFQQQRSSSSNGEPMLVLQKPSAVDAIPQRVAVIRDVNPVSPATEQSFALETAKSAAGPEADVQRIAMPAPEGQSAFLITWQEARPSQGADNVDVTYWQLMHQIGPDLIINVVALAPTAEFETSEVSRILRTFVASSSA